MSWFVPFHKMSQEQRMIATEAVDNPNYVYWVCGCAGVGKTTVLFQMAEMFRQMHPNKSMIVLTYTHALSEMLQIAMKEGYKDITSVQVMTYSLFIKQANYYDFVFLDEVQDVTEQDLLQIRKNASHLYIAGDFNQQIYQNTVSENRLREILSPKVNELKEIYRLTKTVANVASHILPNANFLSGRFANTNADTTAKLIKFDNLNDEYEWLVRESTQRARTFKPCAILFSYHSFGNNPSSSLESFCKFLANKYGFRLKYLGTRLDYIDLNQRFVELDLSFRFFGNNKGSLSESDTKPIVYLMLFHSSKGLDFQSVFIPCVNSDREFWRDDYTQELERRLLFVATTRTRQDLFITYHSAMPHVFLENIDPSYLIHHTKLMSQNNKVNHAADEDDGGGYF